MTKKAYMQPVTNVVKIQQRASILSASDNYGMNTEVQDETVGSAWIREHKSVWDDDWSE